MKNIKEGDIVTIHCNGSIYKRQVERVTKNQIICLDGNNNPVTPSFYAEKFNRVTGKRVGDYIESINYRIVNEIGRYTHGSL